MNLPSMKTIIIDGIEYTLTPTATKHEKELFIGEIDGKKYYLGPEAEEKMTWLDAIYWCTLLGEGYTLPSRIVLLMCHENDTIRDQFMENEYYWTSSDYDSTNAWIQHIITGYQPTISKTNVCRVRSVRVESIK